MTREEIDRMRAEIIDDYVSETGYSRGDTDVTMFANAMDAYLRAEIEFTLGQIVSLPEGTQITIPEGHPIIIRHDGVFSAEFDDNKYRIEGLGEPKEEDPDA